MRETAYIGEILDISTGKRNEQFAYRVGRECVLDFNFIVEGRPMVVFYPNGSYFSTSIVQEVEQTDYGYWIITMNRKYRFDRIRGL